MEKNDVGKIQIESDIYSEKEALLRALAYHRTGDFRSAESIYRKIYVKNPHCADALHLSGLILYHFGGLTAAVLALRRAIRLDGLQPHYYYNLGLILLDKHEKVEAKKCFKKALALDNNYDFAREELLTAEKNV